MSWYSNIAKVGPEVVRILWHFVALMEWPFFILIAKLEP